MGSVVVDQINASGALVPDVDVTLSEKRKTSLLLSALPGATSERYAGLQVVFFEGQVIFRAQVTYLGIPHPVFKKRIQIPSRWLPAYRQALADGLNPRFIGIYHRPDVTIFVDFEPDTYVLRAGNNSSAHVATNDLFQAQTLGVFERVDAGGNRVTSVRFDCFADHLRGRLQEQHPYDEVFEHFNAEFLTGERLDALTALQEMHTVAWKDRFQNEWAGFYLEYRVDEFLRRSGAHRLVGYQKVKTKGSYDYDLIFKHGRALAFYGDLKASNITARESLGNDKADLERCIAEFGRFWYVVYEHDTWHSRDEGDVPVQMWNEWRREVGYVNRKGEYDPLSYAKKFKSAVRFRRMHILEVNQANFGTVLVDFAQGPQPSGAPREGKVKIPKKAIDNFLIYSAWID